MALNSVFLKKNMDWKGEFYCFVSNDFIRIGSKTQDAIKKIKTHYLLQHTTKAFDGLNDELSEIRLNNKTI